MVELEEALALKVRDQIYKAIDKAPGLHFRELQRRTNLAVGSLQYHIDYLQRAHLIKTDRHGKFVRYYTIRGKQLGEDTRTMSLLRQPSLRQIAMFLLTRRSANNAKIAAHLNLSPSTTSWHVTKLVEAEILGKRRRGRKTFFYIQDKCRVAKLLTGYRKSFLDEAVDNFAQIWKALGQE